MSSKGEKWPSPAHSITAITAQIAKAEFSFLNFLLVAQCVPVLILSAT